MSYPPPNPDQYAINGYKFFRLNTPLISDGDMYESAQGAQGFAIGPDSDISKVNIGYFDDQVPRLLNQIAITPERAFPGLILARNESSYQPSGRPGRILIWSDELYNPTWSPSFIDIAGRIDFEVPVMDIVQYFAPAASSMNSGRNDKEYWYEFINAPFTDPVAGTGDSFAKALNVITLTDAAGLFTPAMVGLPITIAGATTAGNDGLFFVQSYISPTQITYNNAAGAAEAFAGTWTVSGVGPNAWVVVIPWYGRRFFNLVWQNNQLSPVDVAVSGLHYKPGTNETAAVVMPLIDDGLAHGGFKFVTVPAGRQLNAVVTSSAKTNGGSVSVIGDEAKAILQVNAGTYDALAISFTATSSTLIDPRTQCTARLRTSDRENG
jgi:hypothetical protein